MISEAFEATRTGYGRGLLAAGKKNDNVVSLEADLGASCKTAEFKTEFPERSFNLGISEQDMICTAAGMAAERKIAFAATFSIFTERAFEQIRNSVARQNLDVKIMGSHSGLHTGEDGSSAQTVEDIAIYRTLPNMHVIVPADSVEGEAVTLAAAETEGPFYLRFGRNKTPVIYDENYKFEIGTGSILKEGSDITIIACGVLVSESLKAAEILEKDGISARVVNMSSIKPIDSELIEKCASETGLIVTAEDHSIIGGLGSAVAEVLSERRPTRLVRIGVQDVFGESGSPEELYKKYGLDAESIAEKLKGEVK
ncbi:TPA: transketolase family protein [archaeon]|nr:transketolase family protein [Candidatus Undinarchaeales archaeon SRR5007147.bin71]